MLPDTATLYIAGASEGALGIKFWQDVYGFCMDPIAAAIRQDNLSKAVVAEVAAENIVTEAVGIRQFDLMTMKPNEADFTAPFALHQSTKVCFAMVYMLLP